MPDGCSACRWWFFSYRRFCFPLASRSQPVDPHELFEAKCGRCHGHAGDFAREALTIVDDNVVGRQSGKPVLETLARHPGSPSEAEASLIVDMFRRQILSDGVYKAKCRFCHDPAKDLARQALILREGQLLGRYSGRSIKGFLGYHGRLDGDEQIVVLDMLTWQLEVAGADAGLDQVARPFRPTFTGLGGQGRTVVRRRP